MKKDKSRSIQAEPKKQIDLLFDQYSDNYQIHTPKLFHWICIPLILFSILGLVWSIPFPHLDFMGRYNGYVNWASFLIAFSIYYYYKLSPIMSYLMLIFVFILAMGVVQLEQWQANGGPALWLVCAVLFIGSWIVQFIGHKIEGKKPSFLTDVKFLLIGPIWLMHFICLKTGLRY
jgi:uncharacterized membrane protein YGL010W